MTKPKNRKPGEPSALELARYRMRLISHHLAAQEPLNAADRLFLAAALEKIGAGEDAAACLGVKAGRGQRLSKSSIAQQTNIVFVLSWIAAVIRPGPIDGWGYSLEDAFEIAAKEFKLSPETIRHYWDNNPSLRSPSFPQPVSSLPRKETK
jgi:hypothetical protein